MKKFIFVILITVVFLLFTGTSSATEAGYRRATRTATQAEPTATERVRETPTVTVGFPTNTPVSTSEPTETITPTVTAEIPTPSATATVGNTHDVTVWHEPSDFHHHGHNPADVHPAIREFLDDNPIFEQIGHSWESSPIENLFPYPLGKHEGWKLLVENNTNCDAFNNGGEFPVDEPCIKAYALWVHDMATAHAFRTAIHSWKGVFLVCERDDESVCGITASGGWLHYGGEPHLRYKKTFCPDVDGFVEFPDNHHLNQPPYVAQTGRDGDKLFWSSLISQVVRQYMPEYNANTLFESAFSVSQWSRTSDDPALCNDHMHDIAFCPDGSCDQNSTQYRVFTLIMHISDFPRPYNGFVDLNGIENTSCTEDGPNCVPLIIEDSVPLGDAILNRQVAEEFAPLLDYDPNDTLELRMPGYTP